MFKYHRFLSLFVLFILNICFLYGQKTITGQILNKDNSPSEYVIVSVFAKDSLIQSTQTDSLGIYNLVLKSYSDYYTLSISSWGIKVYEETITNFESATLTKNIILNDVSSIDLGAVTITEQRNEFQLKNDRFVYSPDISLLKSNSAFDLLKHIPLIKVDNDKISLVYKSGTIIYVNNRPLRMPVSSLIEYLKTTPADNIKNIEVITNPGSNHEASITGGIINIILRKNIDDGYRVQVMLIEDQSRVNSQTASTSFKLHKKNFGLQGGLSALNYPSKEKDRTEIITKNGENQNIKSKINSKSKGVNFNLNAEYSPNDKHFFNLFSSIRYNEPNMETNSFTYFNNTNNNVDSITYTLNKDRGNKIRNYFFNVTYSYLIDDKGQSMNVSADYLDYSNPQYRYNQNNLVIDNGENKELSNYKTSVPQDINAYSAKIDYTLPLAKKNTLNVGALYSYNKNDNSYEWSDWINSIYIPNPARSNKFIYEEKISAAYISLSRQWSDKVNTYLGLRSEYTATKLDLTERKSEKWNKDYFRLFPSFTLNLQPNTTWKVNYSFSGKTQRPAFWQLNPVRSYSNEYLYIANNPSLNSIKLYTQNLTVSLKNKYIFIAEHTLTKDDIGQFLMPDPANNNINYYGQFNYGDRSCLYVSFITSFNFFNEFWKNDVSVGFQYDHFKMKNSDISKYYENENSLNGIFRISNTFRLSEKQNIWGYLNFRYYSPNIYLTSKSISYPVFDLELKKIWSQWTLSLKAYDIFQGNKSVTKMTSDQKLSPYIRNTFTTYPNSRSVSLRISYSFGNSKTKSNRSVRAANEEVRSRVK